MKDNNQNKNDTGRAVHGVGGRSQTTLTTCMHVHINLLPNFCHHDADRHTADYG